MDLCDYNTFTLEELLTIKERLIEEKNEVLNDQKYCMKELEDDDTSSFSRTDIYKDLADDLKKINRIENELNRIQKYIDNYNLSCEEDILKVA